MVDVVIGVVVGTPRLHRNRRKRAVLAFDVRAEPSGRFVHVVVRGRKATEWSRIVRSGLEVRLDGDVRPVVFLRATRLRPALEKWKAKVTG